MAAEGGGGGGNGGGGGGRSTLLFCGRLLRARYTNRYTFSQAATVAADAAVGEEVEVEAEAVAVAAVSVGTTTGTVGGTTIAGKMDLTLPSGRLFFSVLFRACWHQLYCRCPVFCMCTIHPGGVVALDGSILP